MNEIYLHIGLHKTATKYFQHYVFPFLSKNEFIYNPTKLDQYLMDYLKANNKERKIILNEIILEKKKIFKKNPNKKIIISREIMSGNLFSAYKSWNLTTQLLKDMFPNAHIIISLRFQPDWLLSCYRESIHEHHYQKIEKFLCYDKNKKKFYNPTNNVNNKGYVNLYALNLNYEKMLKILFKLFSKNNVSIFFFENFKKNKNRFTKKILKILGSNNKIKQFTGIPNKGYSSFTIKLSILRANVFKKIKLNKFVHRPIYFFGKNSIPAGNPKYSILNKNKYWGDKFKKDNEEIRSENYPNLNLIEKIRMEFSWRNFIKKRFDKLYYYDNDPLKNFRNSLEKEYKIINKNLVNLINKKDIPKKYYQ
jgi:hypothetical protein